MDYPSCLGFFTMGALGICPSGNEIRQIDETGILGRTVSVLGSVPGFRFLVDGFLSSLRDDSRLPPWR